MTACEKKPIHWWQCCWLFISVDQQNKAKSANTHHWQCLHFTCDWLRWFTRKTLGRTYFLWCSIWTEKMAVRLVYGCFHYNRLGKQGREIERETHINKEINIDGPWHNLETLQHVLDYLPALPPGHKRLEKLSLIMAQHENTCNNLPETWAITGILSFLLVGTATPDSSIGLACE